MKREAFDHTKIKRLCRRMKIPLWQAVGLLETLWQLTGKQAPRGDIGRLSNEDIAIGIDYQDDEDFLIEALLYSGWLDQHPEHRLLIHDWDIHADDGINMKLARARLTFAVGTIPKTSRLPKWEREEADTFYASVRTESKSVRTESQNVSTAYEYPAPPRPAPPYPESSSAAAEIPKVSPPKKNGHATKADRAILQRELDLREYAKQALLTYPGSNALYGSPDDVVIGKCLDLCRGYEIGEEEALKRALVTMAQARKQPATSWMWFPTVMAQYLERRA